MAVSNPPVRMKQLLADFVVIVLGVLVALALDEYASGRRDRAAERQYAARLAADLAADTTTFAWLRGILDVKARTLGELLEDPIAFTTVDDPEEKLSALNRATFWGLMAINTATFEELKSTGSLRLLRDPALRSRLTGHYSGYERVTQIIDMNHLNGGRFKEITISSLPGSLHNPTETNTLAGVDEDALRRGLEAIVAHPDIRGAVNAELQYTWLMRSSLADADAQTRGLLATIDSMY